MTGLTQRPAGALLAQTLAPEIELLIWATRANSARKEEREINDALTAAEWDRFCAQLTYHGVTSLVYARLQRVFVTGVVPSKNLCRLHESCLNWARRELFLTRRLLQLLDVFESADIPVIPLKGPVLGEALYCNSALRQFEDLDLLVRKRDVPRTMRLLAEHGYSLESALSWLPLGTLIDLKCELTFRGHCGTQVDLHWEIAPSDYPFRFDTEILWSSLCPVKIGETLVQTASAESLLWFLCVHGAKHLWARLQWLCDLARLIEISPRIDWSEIFNLAGTKGGEHVVLLGLLLASNLLDAPVPSELLKRAKDDRLVWPLAAQVKRRLFETTPRAPESWELVIFNAKMADRLRDKLRHLMGLLKAPTDADARLLRLPPKLFLLYYPFRVCRMALKYGSQLAVRCARTAC